MSNDGANKVDAESAMKAVLGGDDPSADDINEQDEPTPEEVRERIEKDQGGGYEGSANVIAWGLIQMMDENPEMREWPEHTGYEWKHEDDGTICPRSEFFDCDRGEHDFVKKEGDDLTQAAEEWRKDHPEFDKALSGASGFMWGWAVNAAKFVHSAPPVPNPAIITVGG